MKTTKAQINREIKANGGVFKRRKIEILETIQYHIEKYEARPVTITIVSTLLWTLGFDAKNARVVAKKLVEESRE